MDSIDDEIIKVLRADGRSTCANIAKKINISPGIVQARYNKMKRTGIIKGSAILLNLKKIGMIFNASIGIKAIDSELYEVLNYIKELKIEEAELFPFITFGRFNINVAIFSKNLMKAHELGQLIQRHPSVLSVSISLSCINDDDSIVEKYRLSDKKPNTTQTIFPLDKVDEGILQILCKDARTPFNKIAKTLGVATQTVFRKFERLQKNGVITGSTVILSTKAYGIKGSCGLYIKLKPGASLLITQKKMANINQSLIIHPKWGEYDFHVTTYYCDFQEIIDLIHCLRKLKEILTIEMMLYALGDLIIPPIFTFERGLPSWVFVKEN